MAAQQNFRSAFNGFNREDVVHYLEYITTKHNNEIKQLTAENEELRSQQTGSALVETLQAECAELTRLLEELQAKNADLEKRCAQLEQTPAELDTYRRADRTEKEARERADLIYYQASGVLTDATARVDAAAAEVTDMADQVLRQLTQLQMAVSASKQVLQDAASIMNTIRPNK